MQRLQMALPIALAAATLLACEGAEKVTATPEPAVPAADDPLRERPLKEMTAPELWTEIQALNADVRSAFERDDFDPITPMMLRSVKASHVLWARTRDQLDGPTRVYAKRTVLSLGVLARQVIQVSHSRWEGDRERAYRALDEFLVQVEKSFPPEILAGEPYEVSGPPGESPGQEDDSSSGSTS
jgi:hypothetical protein